MLPLYSATEYTKRGVKRGVIRGKVQKVHYALYDHGRLAWSAGLPKEAYPYGINNINAWVESILDCVPARYSLPFINLILQNGSDQHRPPTYTVNGGEGAKVGRGSKDNVFSVEVVGVWNNEPISLKLDIFISALSYQQEYHNKVKSGEHVPQRRTPETLLAEVDWSPYIQADRVYIPVDLLGEGQYSGWQEFDMTEYLTEHPELVGKLPVRA